MPPPTANPETADQEPGADTVVATGGPGNLDGLLTEWLDHLGISAATRIRYRRSLLDWAEWCDVQGFDSFGSHIGAAIADWEASLALRLAEDTARRRAGHVRSFYTFVARLETRDHALARRPPTDSGPADAHMRAAAAADSLHSELKLPPTVPVQINIGADVCWGELHGIRIQVNIASNLTAAGAVES